jgi:hypothetical protein
MSQERILLDRDDMFDTAVDWECLGNLYTEFMLLKSY